MFNLLYMYLGFCMGCILVSDLNYNNNLDYNFRYSKVPLYVIAIRMIISPILVPLIFVSEIIDYVNSKGI
ncbi:MAG: hypothetical protein NC222_06285 [Staphylococcus sp.]|nr:hypothetical protein [Staphylococcus sp.]